MHRPNWDGRKRQELRPPGQLTDGEKALIDWCKHITTLSLGAIVLTPALLEKITPHPRGRWWLAVSLGCYATALLFSMLAMLGAAAGVRRHTSLRERLMSILGVGWTAFVLGTFALAAFAIGNLIRS